MTMRALAICAALTLPYGAFAAGGGSAPTASDPNAECKAGEVYDTKTKACKPAEDASLQDADRMNAARYFAYMGDYDAALGALDYVADAGSADALTLRGFATRKAGDFDSAMGFYTAALQIEPNHWQARSYMGQGLLEKGDTASAREQLTLIRMSGGRGTWAEVSLRQAIERGAGYSY